MADKKINNETFGIIGLTLGILSIIFMGSNGIIVGIVGLIFGWIQQKKHPNKIGKAAMIVSAIGIVLALVFIIVLIKFLAPYVQQQIPNMPLA